jgi:hypothetical protein
MQGQISHVLLGFSWHQWIAGYTEENPKKFESDPVIVLKTGPVSEPVTWLTHWFTGPTDGSAGSIAKKNHQI